MIGGRKVSDGDCFVIVVSSVEMVLVGMVSVGVRGCFGLSASVMRQMSNSRLTVCQVLLGFNSYCRFFTSCCIMQVGYHRLCYHTQMNGWVWVGGWV